MGVGVRDRFRDLEEPATVRKKDVVLMATVTSFEGLTHPSKSELRQFAELFTPSSRPRPTRQNVRRSRRCRNA